ncbi:MAG TPA: hypothetical protein VKT52_00730 [Ktedonobacterales bacterium]|nr:hypothetical protein [Ktedonobacterales bacterium]
MEAVEAVEAATILRRPLEALARQRVPRVDEGARRKTPGAGWIVLLVVLCAAYFIPRGTSWNADTHLFLTASIVDRGALNIDPLAAYTGDKSFANGHYYADKAPGLSLAAIPAYILVKQTLMGGKPYTSFFAVPEDQRTDFLVRYLLAILYAALPTGILAALLYAFLARLVYAEPWRAVIALTYGLGTMALPFAGEFFSHQLAAVLLFGGFVLLYRIRHGELRERLAPVAGFLLGYAILTEYPTALIAGALGVYALTAPVNGRRLVGLLALGAAPPLLVGAIYNTLAFGGPLSQGYANLAGPEVFRTGQAQGFMGITYPHLDALWQTTLGPYRGIFLLSPVLLLAIPGFRMLWKRLEWRAETWLWLAIVAVYGLFSISYFAWDGGFSMGPRQFLPALPFLMLPIGEVTQQGHDRRWRIAAGILVVVSVLIVGAATAVGPLFDPRYASPLTQWVWPRLLAGQLDNNWGMLFGLPGLLQLLPLAVLAAIIVFWHWRSAQMRAAAPQHAGG